MNTKDLYQDTKVKVVFYARVSTEEEEQKYSLNQQVEYFEKFIKENKDWEYAGMYVERGITGTSAKKRPQFLKMINDAKDGKFSVILTKEVSRFARNTVDTLHYTRELKKYGVCVVFTLDNINTLDKDGELRLTIMASLAQEEARKISERTKWGHDKSMSKGIVYGNGNILGYNIIDRKLVVNEQQAKIVKQIYDLYLFEGLGIRAIKTILENQGCKSPNNKTTWTESTISRILKNEKYIGNLKQKKYITVDYLDKVRKKNTGEENFIETEDVHEPIVSKEVFYKVQEEFERRKKLLNLKTRYSNKYIYSSKLICGTCGKTFKRIVWNSRTDGTKIYAWLCNERAKNGKKRLLGDEYVGCDAIGMPEPVLNEIMKKFIQELWDCKDEIMDILKKVFEKHYCQSDYTNDILDIKKTIEKANKKIEELIELKLEGEITKDQFKNKKQEYDLVVSKNEELLKTYDKKTQLVSNATERLNKMIEFFNQEIDFDNNNVPDSVIEILINKIVIYDKHKLQIYINNDLSYNVVYDKYNFEVLPFAIDHVQSCNQNIVKIYNTIFDLRYAVPTTLATRLKLWNNIEVEVYMIM